MRVNRYVASALLLAVTAFAALLPARAATDGAGFERITPDQVVWQDVPDGRGVKMAVISGDPSQPGIYVVRVKFPPGIMTSPHFHGEDRYAVVLKGTWYTGTSDDWDPAKTVGLPAGSFMKHPAKAVHFDGAKDEEVIVQIAGQGPSSTTWLYPSETGFGHAHKLK
jgi:quercetin dioxygenase-like cupin family protein